MNLNSCANVKNQNLETIDHLMDVAFGEQIIQNVEQENP